jgi:hypothetical protein
VRSNSPRRAVAALAVGLLGASVPACSSGPISYIVLTLKSSTATMPIFAVTDVDVHVFKQGGAEMNALSYHHAPLDIGMDGSTTLSVSFTGSQSGNVSLVVEARASGCLVATGTAPGVIQRGARTDTTVTLSAVTGCPGRDGGTESGAIFPGCDPVNPSCGANMTCQVNCMHALGECTAGGSRPAGSTCSMNSDCTPGTQCFDYTPTGCPVKVCLRFCNTVAECAQPGPDAGVNPGSVCAGPVECMGVTTGYHTCTFGCDPRLAAITSGAVGCPTGLSCLLVGDNDQVDCACPESTRTKHEGEDCQHAYECAPGLVCDLMNGMGKCRPICHCAAQGGNCTAADSDCPTANTRCVPLATDTIYGACL